MPYLTLTEKPKATTKQWFSRLLGHPDRKCSGSILGHTDMLTSSRHTRGHRKWQRFERRKVQCDATLLCIQGGQKHQTILWF